MNRVVALVAVVLLAGLPSGCGDSSPTSGESGSIVVHASRNGVPVVNALVVLVLPGRADSVVAMATTDDDGQATLDGIEEGTYSIEVSKTVEGHLIYDVQEDVAIGAGPNAERHLVLSNEVDDLSPLALGNTWTYSAGGDGTWVLGVFSTKVIRGTTTYAVGPETGGSPAYETRGLRVIYWLGWDQGSAGDHILPTPAVFLDFDATEGASWVVPGWGEITLEEIGAEVTVPAGTFGNCMWFGFERSGRSDEGPVAMCVAPGVGAVKWLDAGDAVYELLEYELHQPARGSLGAVSQPRPWLTSVCSGGTSC